MNLNPKDAFRLKLSLGILLFGFLVLAFALSPIINQPQCPVGITQEQFEKANCSTGVNIGLGLMLFVDMGIFAVGVLSLIITVIIARSFTMIDKLLGLVAISATVATIVAVLSLLKL